MLRPVSARLRGFADAGTSALRPPRALDVAIGLVAAGLVVDLFLWKSRARFPFASLRPEDILLGGILLLAVRWWLKPPRLVPAKPHYAVAAGVMAYALVFSFVAVTRHRMFQTHALDLGQCAQNLWHIARGQQPYDTILGWHAWGNHLSPIFYVLAPLTLVFQGPTFLLVLQSVALALGAVPVYFFARARVGAEHAATFAGLYLLNPSLHGVNVRDFHPAALAITLLLAAMYAADAHRMSLFWLATGMTLATREDAAIAVVGLGLWLVVVLRRFVLGAALIVVAIGWLFAAVEWVMPMFRDDHAYPYITAHYRHLGDSLAAVLLTPIQKPLTVFVLLLTVERLRYVLALLAPLVFLPLLAVPALLGALPGLAQNLLSDYPVLFHHRSQYQSFVLPFLVIAAILGLERLSHRIVGATRLGWLTPARALACAALASAALSARTMNDFALTSWRLAESHRAAYRLLDAIPAGATVSAGERLFPHLYDRATVFVFPGGVPGAEYVLVDRSLLRTVIVAGDSTNAGGVVVLRPYGAPTATPFLVVRAERDIVLLRRVRTDA